MRVILIYIPTLFMFSKTELLKYSPEDVIEKVNVVSKFTPLIYFCLIKELLLNTYFYLKTKC